MDGLHGKQRDGKLMKILFVGLGSIGTRHLKNIHACCKQRSIEVDVTALRSTEKPLPEEINKLIHHSQTELTQDEEYDIAFITGPTHLHGEVLARLKGKVASFFIEKPIFENTNYSLESLGLGKNQKAYVAAPMRWCGVYKELKKELLKHRVYSVRSICSSYLPDWRPNSDYTKVYSAHKEMGGGVSLDLIHEWDYLVDLFGEPQTCINMQGTFSHLAINSDDLSVYIARYPEFLCELHLDYFGRQYRREVEVFTEEGSLKADFGSGLLCYPNGTCKDCNEDANERYKREMDYFISYSLGTELESVNSPQKALDVLQIALGRKSHG